jgi:phage terminase small subunit
MNRKPTALLELRQGRLRARDRAARTNEPQARAAVGPPPKHLSDAQARCWDELVGICPLGVLGDSDRIHLEMTAVLLAAFRAEGHELKPQLIARLSVHLGKLGLNPADRSAVMVPGRFTKNPFGQFDR